MNNNYPQRTLKFAMDTVFPIRCVGCGEYDVYFCDSCLATVKVKKDFECIGCKRPAVEGNTCINCRNDFSVSRLFVAADYNNKLIEKALKLVKYGFIKDLSEQLTAIAKIYTDNLFSQDNFNVFAGSPLLIPVPLHKKRLNWRGFNQSEIFAEKIAAKHGLELGLNILVRTKSRTPQADIKNRESRIINIAGSFKCLNELQGRNVILIDDICTTGATLNECAKALAEKGAGTISALVVARG